MPVERPLDLPGDQIDMVKSIVVSEQTHADMKALKIGRETFEDVIKRLITDQKDGKER